MDKALRVQLRNQPDLYRAMGESCLALRLWRRAEEAFRTMLDIDPASANAHLGLAECLLPRRRFAEALQEATAAAGLVYHQPRAHYTAGVALSKLGRYEEASAALQTAVSQNPVFPRAHRRLARLYAGPLEDAERATQHRELEQQCRRRLADYRDGKPVPSRHALLIDEGTAVLGADLPGTDAGKALDDTIVVVSGLPRSGTSMMMQMLAAGGCPVLVDDRRAADESNQRGYFEFEAATRLAQDHGWLDQATGKAVKIVAQLLPRLPLHRKYRVIFMERPLTEVVASQQMMLERLGRSNQRSASAQLARTFHKQVETVGKILTNHARQISVVSVNYAEALSNPRETAARVNRFLGGTLDESAMAAAVSPALRHQVS